MQVDNSALAVIFAAQVLAGNPFIVADQYGVLFDKSGAGPGFNNSAAMADVDDVFQAGVRCSPRSSHKPQWAPSRVLP